MKHFLPYLSIQTMELKQVFRPDSPTYNKLKNMHLLRDAVNDAIFKNGNLKQQTKKFGLDKTRKVNSVNEEISRPRRKSQKK